MKVIKIFLVSLLFISCNVGDKSNVFDLSWGTDISRAKDTIIKKGLTIEEEDSNKDDIENYEKHGLISWFSVNDKFGGYDTEYILIFHNNKFAEASLFIEYPDVQIQKLRLIELINEINVKYGTPKEESDFFTEWEKDNIFVSIMNFSSSNAISLDYKNENYYNKKILNRYKIIEDTWRTTYLRSYENIWKKLTNINYSWSGIHECKVIISESHITFETYERDRSVTFDDVNAYKLVDIKGPNPYIITGNKITIVDEFGKTVEVQYTLNRNTLIVNIAEDEMEFSRSR